MMASRVHAREGRAPRPRLPLFTGQTIPASKLPAPKEHVLHIQVADLLRDYGHPDWEWTHVPAGELRDKRTAAKLKAMGAKPGWPDIVLISSSGLFHGLELKRRGETLSDVQEAFHARAKARKWPIAVADTFEEAVAILQGWGALRVNITEVL